MRRRIGGWIGRAAVCLWALAGVSIARAESYEPAARVLDELAGVKLKLKAGYREAHPRLAFTTADREALAAKAKAHPKLWQAVVNWADGAKKESPVAKEIRNGSGYHFRPNRAFAAALVGWLTDDPAYKRLAIDWTLAYCKEDMWGGGYKANVDMAATWYSYYFALVYDILYADLTDAEREAIRTGLAAHARAIYQSQIPLAPDAEGSAVQKMIRWEQGHMYMPLIGLGAIGLALSGEVPEADAWNRLVYAKMRRTFWVHPEDGFHWEGPAYWEYAVHWILRYGFLLEQATGERLYDVPHFRHAAVYGRHVGLPGRPYMFDLADCGGVNNWRGGDVGRRFDMRVTYSRYILRGVARAFGDGVAQAMADEVGRKHAYNLDPAIEFLWLDPAVKAADLGAAAPYHHFKDNDAVFWRSGWDDAATCYAFRCGPVEGHSALAKSRRLKDWTMNHGHAHPDIGAFAMYARGAYLAVDTGYLCEKKAEHHNTLLVDGKGQVKDGSYWCYRGVPYERIDRIRILKVHLAKDYGYVCGDMSAAYPDELGKLSIKRHLVMTKDWLLVVDELEADAARTWTWLVHTDGPVEALEGGGRGVYTSRAGAWVQQGGAWTWQPGDASLRVVALGDATLRAETGKCIVGGGGRPGQPMVQQRGYQLALTTPEPTKQHRSVVVLQPLGKGESPHDFRLLPGGGERYVTVSTPGGSMRLDLKWEPPQEPGEGKGPLAPVVRPVEP